MKDGTPRIRACCKCGLNFEQVRRKGWPERYCSRLECLEARRSERNRVRRASRAAQRGIVRAICQYSECDLEFEVPFGYGNQPPHYCTPEHRRMANLADRRRRNRENAKERVPQVFVCQNPECGIEFERENVRGHWPSCCSTPCRRRRRAATIQLRAWLAANPGKKVEDYRAFVHARPGRAARDFRTFPLNEVIARDCGICYLCGEEVTERGSSGRAATRDHIIPLDLGGENSWANICLAHRICNSRKHTRTLEEYLAIYPRKRELPSTHVLFHLVGD